MTPEFHPRQLRSRMEIESRFPQMPRLASFGSGLHRSELYYFRPLDVYFETVPFGKTGTSCFRVCDIYDESGVRPWIESAKAKWESDQPPMVVPEVQMLHPLYPSQTFDVGVVEKRFPTRRLLATYDSGNRETTLEYIEEFDVYLTKGPYGRYEGVHYIVCDFNDRESVDRWLKRHDEFYSKHATY